MLQLPDVKGSKKTSPKKFKSSCLNFSAIRSFMFYGKPGIVILECDEPSRLQEWLSFCSNVGKRANLTFQTGIEEPRKKQLQEVTEFLCSNKNLQPKKFMSSGKTLLSSNNANFLNSIFFLLFQQICGIHFCTCSVST